jgi:hypothetical protein
MSDKEQNRETKQDRIESIDETLGMVEKLHQAASDTRQKGWSDLNLLDAIYATNAALVTMQYEMLRQKRFEMIEDESS